MEINDEYIYEHLNQSNRLIKRAYGKIYDENDLSAYISGLDLLADIGLEGISFVFNFIFYLKYITHNNFL